MKNVYKSSFAKSACLWKKASRSTVASDYVEDTRKLTVPSSTHWNSYYDAASRITENTLEESLSSVTLMIKSLPF